MDYIYIFGGCMIHLEIISGYDFFESGVWQ